MMNKMLEAMSVVLTIGSFIGLFVIIYCTIGIIVCDYEAWKRHKEEKEHCHQMEDKFKNRKLTD